jgi:hypothetical protein
MKSGGRGEVMRAHAAHQIHHVNANFFMERIFSVSCLASPTNLEAYRFIEG